MLTIQYLKYQGDHCNHMLTKLIINVFFVLSISPLDNGPDLKQKKQPDESETIFMRVIIG